MAKKYQDAVIREVFIKLRKTDIWGGGRKIAAAKQMARTQ